MNLRRIFTIALAALFTTVSAEENGTQSVLTIKTSKASKALVEMWANAYMQSHPENKIVVTNKKTLPSDLSYTSEIRTTASKDSAITAVGRYAVLPITTTSNPLSAELRGKEWNKSELKKIFFTSLDETLDEAEEANSGKVGKLRSKLTVYSTASSESVANDFAQKFGFQISEFRGNRISGDDKFLINAIEEDATGITFNNIAYLYDTQTRQLKSGIVILPLKLKSDVEEVIQGGNLDETLRVLENLQSDIIPIAKFGFAYDKKNSKAEDFIEWVVNEGQEYNNKNGFLKL